jgi:hypothetical protein
MAHGSPPDPGHEITGNSTTGMPIGDYRQITPAGELDQFRQLSVGLARLTGWRRTAARLAAAAVLLLIAAGIVAGILHIAG